MMDRLIVKRNRLMLERMRPRLLEGMPSSPSARLGRRRRLLALLENSGPRDAIYNFGFKKKSNA